MRYIQFRQKNSDINHNYINNSVSVSKLNLIQTNVIVLFRPVNWF